MVQVESLSLHEIVKLLFEEAKIVTANARKLLDQEADEAGKQVALQLYYLCLGPKGRLERRVFYTDPARNKDIALKVSGRLIYRARIILDSNTEWQAKVPSFYDAIEEINDSMERAGIWNKG